MTNARPGTAHPTDIELSDYLSGSLARERRDRVTAHIASCDECLGKIVIARDSVEEYLKGSRKNNQKGNFMKKLNIYLFLAIVSFALSFITPRFFLQFLVATLVLGAKWVVDAKTTKMLITVREALKRGDQKEASRILEPLDARQKTRF